MDGVDISKIRVGDEVTVRFAWVGILTNRLWVKRPGAHDSSPLPINAADVVSHTPVPLSVGDRVQVGSRPSTPLYILCIYGVWAWLRDDEGSTTQELLSDLERIQ